MKIIETLDVRKETDKTENAKRVSHIKEFQASPHYETIIAIIDEALGRSLVKELLKKNGGAGNEAEIGRLTLVEWASERRIREDIRDIITRKYD